MRKATLALLMLFVPLNAFAQEVTHSFAQLASDGAIGDGVKLLIVYSAGEDILEIEGEVVEITSTSITIETESQPPAATGLVGISTGGVFNLYRVQIPANRVTEIAVLRSDSLLNGLLIGAGVGAGWGTLAASGCPDNECVAVAIALMTGIGAGIGVGLDAMRKRGRETVYLAPGSPASALTFSLSPIVAKKQKGFLFTLNW